MDRDFVNKRKNKPLQSEAVYSFFTFLKADILINLTSLITKLEESFLILSWKGEYISAEILQ
jgi:hypothetical protein